MIFKEDFFNKNGKELAKDLIGQKLVRELPVNNSDPLIVEAVITRVDIYNGLPKGQLYGFNKDLLKPGMLFLPHVARGYLFAINAEANEKLSTIVIRGLELENPSALIEYLSTTQADVNENNDSLVQKMKTSSTFISKFLHVHKDLNGLNIGTNDFLYVKENVDNRTGRFQKIIGSGNYIGNYRIGF